MLVFAHDVVQKRAMREVQTRDSIHAPAVCARFQRRKTLLRNLLHDRATNCGACLIGKRPDWLNEVLR
jgi:hypothetical protein